MIDESKLQSRADIARVLVEIRKMGIAAPEDRSALWLDQERVQVEEAARSATKRVDELIRGRALSPAAATSFLNDAGYAYNAIRDLIEAARNYYVERDGAIAEVERLLALEEDELNEPEARLGNPHGSGSRDELHDIAMNKR